MTAANWITLSRILLIPVFMFFMGSTWPYSGVVALAIFIVASLTDGIDGYVARKFNQVTTFGKFMDPLADKLLVTAAIIYFVQDGKMAAWAAVIIITREFVVTTLRMVAAAEGVVIASGISGKVKTTVQIICIVFLLTPLYSTTVMDSSVSLGSVAVWLMTAVTVWSGIDYLARHKDFIIKK